MANPAVEPAADRAAPRILGRYAIFDAIAAGGMATVHYGRLLGPVGFSRTVAIKRLHPQFAQDPEFVTMFLDEARLAGRIRHPNVVATLDVVANANEIFLVMDYVHGESLARIFREVVSRDQSIPLAIALRIASDVLLGLHAAHEARDERGIALNIVHRDISPQNILLGVDGTARLVDFGVAKANGQGQTTRDGQLKGKLGYMAPEQLRGNKITRQTDIHAFGIVLWEMLAGRRLFVGESEADTLARVLHHEVPSIQSLHPSYPPEVDVVVQKGLAISLDERYASARDMCIALDACGPMASSMQVADWVLAQAHDLLEARARVVSTIESCEEGSSPRESGTTKSADEWIKRVSEHDLAAKAKDSETLVAPTSIPTDRAAPGVAADVGDPSALDDLLGIPRKRPWLGVAGLAGGLVGLLLVFAIVSMTTRKRPSTAAAAPPPTVAVAAPPSIPPPPDLGTLPAPLPTPVAAASASPENPAPPTPAPRATSEATTRHAPKPSAPRKAPGAPVKPSGDGVYDSRE